MMQETPVTNNASGDFISVVATLGFRELQLDSSESDYHHLNEILDKNLSVMEKIAIHLGQIDVSYAQERKWIKELYAMTVRHLEVIEKDLERTAHLRENQDWGQRIRDKLENLANLVEDISETCVLALSNDFAKMIQSEIQALTDEAEVD